MAVPEDVVPTEAPSTSAPSNVLGLMRAPAPETFGSDTRVLASPNLRFFLAHHPSGFAPEEVKGTVAGVKLDGVYWLPDLAPRIMQPGAAGIRTRGTDEPPEQTYKRAMETSQEAGWVWLDPLATIPAECLPAGVPAGPYLRSIPCKDAVTGQTGERWIEAWNIPTATIKGSPQRFTFQRAEYNLYRAWLVMSGAIAPPMPHVIESVTERMRGRVERAETLPLPDSQLKKRVAAAESVANKHASAKVPARTKAKA